MIKLCLSKVSPLTQAAGTFRSTPAAQQHWQRVGGARVPATLVASAVQQRHPNQAGTRYGQFALRARLSPVFSLFNRLDGFVHQLQGSRDFFADWPQKLCNKIRRQESHASSLAQNLTSPNSEACWNGRDFSG